ncbi:MAG: Gfo/Idh/MocA family oxidoreductase, partial [Deltaproteobacteria bacterium]|nr:Gfo/Idh/MocA family oxidoreductase [Deltaproteobacteria bacterium]
FVDICTPPCFHADQIIAACRAGVHVFCEKPLVTSSAGFHQVKQAADASGRTVFTVNNWKYAPIFAKTVELAAAGCIGQVESVSLSVLRPPNAGGGASDWRRQPEVAGGGILLDHGWHHLYLVLAIINQTPESVSAEMEFAETGGSSLEQTVDLRLRFPGAEAQLHLTWRASSRRNFGQVIGNQGTISINDDHLILSRYDAAPVRYDFLEALSHGSQHLEWMKPVIEGFWQEVCDASVRGANLEEARWCVHLTRLAYQSYKEGSRPIPIIGQIG